MRDSCGPNKGRHQYGHRARAQYDDNSMFLATQMVDISWGHLI